MDLHHPSPDLAPASEPKKPGVPEMRARIVNKLQYQIGKSPERASQRDWFMATAFAVRDGVVECWFDSRRSSVESSAKRVYYLSLEFLIGRLLADTIGNLGLTEVVREALAQEGVDFDDLREREPDAALGNGGLGRLAACFMESMATLEINCFGYGIRYEHGLFKQKIVEGVQEELPEDWLSFGNPWEFERSEFAYRIGFGGTVAATPDASGQQRYAWHPGEQILAVAYDTPVVGGGARHANALRLWSARALTPLHLDAFNRGDHEGAQRDRVRTEAVSRVLYPGDDSTAGQELRLRQEFFFASASLQDLIARHLKHFGTIETLPDKVRNPAQRHPSGDCRDRADAAADGRARPGMGRGVEDHGRNRFLYQPHIAAGSAGGLAGASHGAAASAAHADHLPAERATPGARPQAVRRRRPSAGLDFADRGVGRPPGPHGAPRLPRVARDQWRFGAAHAADQAVHFPGPRPRLWRPDPEQDQRHHLPSLAAPGQSGADRTAGRNPSASAC